MLVCPVCDVYYCCGSAMKLFPYIIAHQFTFGTYFKQVPSLGNLTTLGKHLTSFFEVLLTYLPYIVTYVYQLPS